MIKKEAPMTAMDHIWADPVLFTAYRIGTLKQRILELETALDSRDLSDEDFRTLDDEKTIYEEELSALRHLHSLLTKGN